MTTGMALLEITLEAPDEEDAFMAWWDEARRLVVERFRATDGELCVLGRGRYQVRIGFPLAATWGLVAMDRRWRALEETRPAARVEVRAGRVWHREGNPRDITTAELRRLLAERERANDVVVVDVLPPDSYARRHLPRAVNLPLASLDEARARARLGSERRTVVVYCGGYG